MVALALAAVFVTLASCAAGCSANTHSTSEREPLSAAIQTLDNLTPECENTTCDQEAGTQLEFTSPNSASMPLESNRNTPVGEPDPCYHYTVLDQAWRATNASTKSKMCDRNVSWRGWYRLFYGGNGLQMPERCVPVDRCGTHAPLWLAGPHPRRRDGVVTRNVCGHWQGKCCAFLSTPIQVKKCMGNYYVYKFAAPSTCYLAYCADVNTLVCGRCTKYELCVSRDKINWRCQRRRSIPMKIHFFASFPAQLSGKVNRIKYSRVLVNMGRAFDRRNGLFRAPVAGVYQFFFSTQASGAGVKTDLWLVVNDYWVAVSHTHLPRGSTAGGLSTYMSYLNRGAVVYVTHNCGQSWANAASSTITFGGSLLVQWR
ncbi:unnamed protein product [Ophioblennius macclurei]